MENPNKKAILLIDGDNANKFSDATFSSIFTVAKKYGFVTEAHIFVNGQSIKGDKKNEMLLEMVTKYALRLHVLPIKKNSTDISLAIRATEKLYTDENIEVYIIVVAGDHDYMPLAIEIRQHNKQAICFYTKDKDATLLSAFCSHEKINANAITSEINKQRSLKSEIQTAHQNKNETLTLEYAQKVKGCFKFNSNNICYIANLGGALSKNKISYKELGKPLKDILKELFSKYPKIFNKYSLNLTPKSEHIKKNK